MGGSIDISIVSRDCAFQILTSKFFFGFP